MKNIFSVLAISLFCNIALIACSPQSHKNADILSITSPKGTAVFQDNWENMAAHYHFPEWFMDAKFGIFIHWGVFSVPSFGSEWYPRKMYMKDSLEFIHHVQTYGSQAQFGYKDFIPLFKGEHFDADEWVKLFKAAGAKYVVPVGEFHDGFAMYDSDINPWNAVKMGPHKDIIGILKKAIEKEGLVFGVSSHYLENSWFFNEGMKFPSDVQDTTITLYGERLEKVGWYTDKTGSDFMAHTKELIDKYQPQLLWFDWTVGYPVIDAYFNKIMAYYYNCSLDWEKGVVINTKEGYPNNIQVGDVERGKLNEMRKYPWQTDTSIGKKSWSYVEDEENKSPGQIVRDLVDIVSKNGNLLLNVGPRPDGTITEEQKEVLLTIGRWLNVNGEAIYGSRCWKKYGEGDATDTSGSFSDGNGTVYTNKDIRFTTKGNTLYAIVLDWSENAIIITSLTPQNIGNAKILKVELLGSEALIPWEMTTNGLKLSFPKEKPCDYAYSFKITFDQEPGADLASEMIDIPLKH